MVEVILYLSLKNNNNEKNFNCINFNLYSYATQAEITTKLILESKVKGKSLLLLQLLLSPVKNKLRN